MTPSDKTTLEHRALMRSLLEGVVCPRCNGTGSDPEVLTVHTGIVDCPVCYNAQHHRYAARHGRVTPEPRTPEPTE
jgi:hypothetical protein